jgi:hypothetical protein
VTVFATWFHHGAADDEQGLTRNASIGMKICVELLSGQKQWVTVEAADTVERAVSKLSLSTDAANTGSSTGQGRSILLRFGEKTLSAASALQTYGIKDDSTLHELADDTVTVDSASGGGGGETLSAASARV